MKTQRALLKQCYSKRKFTNIDECNLAGLEIIKHSNKAMVLYMYLCSNCNKWHLTKQFTKHRVV